MGSLLAWLFLKSNDPHYNAFHGKEGKKKAGAKPPENCWDHFCSIKENALLIQRRHCKKGTIVLLMKKSGVQTPRTP